jgi:hypothetical protein
MKFQIQLSASQYATLAIALVVSASDPKTSPERKAALEELTDYIKDSFVMVVEPKAGA